MKENSKGVSFSLFLASFTHFSPFLPVCHHDLAADNAVIIHQAQSVYH